VHAGRAAEGGGGQDQPADQVRPDQSYLLCDEATDGVAEDVGLAELEGGEEGDGVVRHLLDDVRRGPGGAADAGVVERHDPPGRG
jgi:hypothetical protein